MSRKITDQDNFDSTIEWIFPRIDLSVKSENSSNYDDENNKKNEEINQLKLELNKKIRELENLGNELNNKITIINTIMNQLQDAISLADKEYILLIQNMIKKASKNIIGKELQLDPKLINKMINTLSELIQKNNGILTVYLSDDDFKIFKADELDKLVSVKADPELRRGDIIIKSNCGEIHAILDERLNKLLGLKYESQPSKRQI